MKITIIGANSYIARNLIYYIKQNEQLAELYLYDRANIHKDGLENYWQMDVTEPKSFDRIHFDCDVIFLFTGMVGTLQGFDLADEFIDVNEKVLIQLLNAYRNKNSKAKIIFPSTRLVYKGNHLPLAEDAEKEFKTVYAMNKFACENYLSMYHNIFHIPYCILRIGIPYGTMVEKVDSYGTIEFFLKKASAGEEITLYGDGEQRRTFTHIEDLCKILWNVAVDATIQNEVFNVGGENASLKEVAEKIAQKYNVGLRHIPWPAKNLLIESGDTVFDAAKLEQKINCSYQYTIDKWIGDN